MRLLLSLFLFTFTHFTFAGAVKVTNVVNASNYDITTDTNNPIIFGGVAGTCSSEESTSTCNSCVSGTVEQCNNFRIHETLVLKISFTVTAELTGTIMVTDNDGKSLASVFDIPTGTYTTGDTSTVEVVWGTLCANYQSLACKSISATLNETVYIGIDGSGNGALESGEYTSVTIKVVNPALSGGDYNNIHCNSASPSVGICNFTAAPGDEKVIIEDNSLVPLGGFPNTSSTTIEYLRLFYSTSGFDDITYSSEYHDLELDSDGKNVLNAYIEGFTNDTTYFFKMASIDKAKNVFAFTSDQAISDACQDKDPSVLNASDDLNCGMIATPAEVFGLLTEDLNCFITTAAYGSSFHNKVKDFRKFRNQFLIPTKFGRIINNYYYKYGPYAARFISKYETLKAASRVALFPIWLFAKTSLKYGLFVAFSSVIFVLFLGFALIHTMIKGRRQRTVTA